MNDQPVASGIEQTPGLVRVASDELLLLGARLHDDVALGVLFDRYASEVYALALGMLRDRDAAESVVQDVFLRCWRGVEIYDAAYGTTHDWLLGIARSRSMDALNALSAFGGGAEVVDALRSAAGRDDSGLLPPEQPASGARNRLLSRARAESGGLRSSDAPTVVIPVAELAPTVVIPVAELAPAAEPGLMPELASEAPTLTNLPVLGPDLDDLPDLVDEESAPDAAVELDEPITTTAPALVMQSHTAADIPTLETTDAAEPLETSATEAADPPTVEAAALTLPAAELSEPGSQAPESAAPESPPMGPPSPESKLIGSAAPDLPPIEPPAPDLPAPGSKAPKSPPVVAPASEAQTSEVPVSEALAAALAPISPRRPGRQQPRQTPGPEDAAAVPPRRRIKLASIFWGIALLFVMATGLFGAAWSATAPHVSPEVAILSRLPGGRVLVLRGMGVPNASARLHTIDSGRRAELAVDGMPALPNGQVYQAWIAEAGQPVRSAGSFFVNRKGDAVMPAAVGIPSERIQAVFVTQEPAPGSSAPRGPRLLQWAP